MQENGTRGKAPGTDGRRLSSILIWLAVVAMVSPARGYAQARPDLILHGVITRADHHTYRMLPFAVPAGLRRITVHFSYTGCEQHTTLDIGLFDPSGFRGWSGGNKDSFTSQQGLDFVAVTDHNTTSDYDASRELAPYFDRLLLLRGREITTFQGHLNVYGTDQFVDFRVARGDLSTMNAVLRRVNDLRGPASMNHPIRPTGEECMGCGWAAKPEADLRLFQAIEVVNSIDADTGYSGIPFWEVQLSRGYRLTAVGGSDNHSPDDSGASAVGHPTTVVYAKELSESAILEGIRAGRAFIDVEGSSDRALEFTASGGGSAVSMGESLTLSAGTNATFSVRVRHIRTGKVEIVQDGALVDAGASFTMDRDDETKTFPLRGDGRRHWLRVNVRSSEGKLLLVGNPFT